MSGRLSEAELADYRIATHRKDGRMLVGKIDMHAEMMRNKLFDHIDSLAAANTENERLRQRLLTAAGDDLCRLTQEEIKDLTGGKVPIPPKAEFLASCERFHAQIAAESGVNHGCLTLAQLVAENERLNRDLTAIGDQNGAPTTYHGNVLTPEGRLNSFIGDLKAENERLTRERNNYENAADCMAEQVAALEKQLADCARQFAGFRSEGMPLEICTWAANYICDLEDDRLRLGKQLAEIRGGEGEHAR